MIWTRRQFLATAAAAPTRRPNVLVFMSDQESALVPGPVSRPHLDRMHREGVRFRNAFCNTPQCSAARSALLTGREPHHTGVLTNVDGGSLGKPLDRGTAHVGTVFGAAGYRTGYFGKWHLGGTPFGFETVGPEHNDERIARDAADWVGRQRAPWLGWVSILNPHNIYALKQAVNTRPGVRPPSSGLADLATKPREQQEYVDKDQGRATRDYKTQDWIRYRSYYCELLEKVDTQFGTVLKAVPDLDNTVVVYISDHGDALGEHGLPFKGPFMYEELIRVPLVVRAPRALRAGVRDDLVTQADVAPTLAALAGVAWPAPVDGKALDRPITRDAVFLEYYAKQKWVNPIRTIHTRRWKLNWYDRGNRELYDLEKDPHEVRNLAGHAEWRKVETQLMQRLTAWRAPQISA